MKKILITGGCGFIGTNTAFKFKELGWDVTLFDNLSRKGTPLNLSELQKDSDIKMVHGDIRDKERIEETIKEGQFDYILHLAAQVAVTTSVVDPVEDFEINAQGTLNILESIRNHSKDSFILFASTNKVYGNLAETPIEEKESQYSLIDSIGISEEQPLSFHSPYGCSKGAADQYILDYAKIYGLKTTVFRQSCIYGRYQYGIEDQGWMAWMALALKNDLPITVYGDGKQVRDALYVDDLVNAYQKAYEYKDDISGEAFNIGGGLKNSISIIDYLTKLKTSLEIDSNWQYSEWRPGDQKIYISDITKASKMFKWTPEYSIDHGVDEMINWMNENSHLLNNYNNL